jgi:hypothetical protein
VAPGRDVRLSEQRPHQNLAYIVLPRQINLGDPGALPAMRRSASPIPTEQGSRALRAVRSGGDVSLLPGELAPFVEGCYERLHCELGSSHNANESLDGGLGAILGYGGASEAELRRWRRQRQGRSGNRSQPGSSTTKR